MNVAARAGAGGNRVEELAMIESSQRFRHLTPSRVTGAKEENPLALHTRMLANVPSLSCDIK
jgi:hypothetical protein